MTAPAAKYNILDFILSLHFNFKFFTAIHTYNAGSMPVIVFKKGFKTAEMKVKAQN